MHTKSIQIPTRCIHTSAAIPARGIAVLILVLICFDLVWFIFFSLISQAEDKLSC